MNIDRRQISRVNNAQGRIMEDMIIAACREYERLGIAHIVKVPEPFRVIRNTDRQRAVAMVRFTAKAQPDFVGCISGGRLIAFEAKYTQSDRIRQNVVTDKQAEALQAYSDFGCKTYVCCGIGTGFDLQYFMVPWDVWDNMKSIFGHAYATPDELRPWQIKADTAIWVFDPVH